MGRYAQGHLIAQPWQLSLERKELLSDVFALRPAPDKWQCMRHTDTPHALACAQRSCCCWTRRARQPLSGRGMAPRCAYLDAHFLARSFELKPHGRCGRFELAFSLVAIVQLRFKRCELALDGRYFVVHAAGSAGAQHTPPESQRAAGGG